jgi:hypothetical protein
VQNSKTVAEFNMHTRERKEHTLGVVPRNFVNTNWVMFDATNVFIAGLSSTHPHCYLYDLVEQHIIEKSVLNQARES